MLDTDLFESQTTSTKNLIKTFRPKTVGHPRFEFVKKATASFNGSYLCMCVISARGEEHYASESVESFWPEYL